MATDSNNANKLAFSSQCPPGSVAEQKEKERLAAFRQQKEQQKADDELTRPERDAKRDEEYNNSFAANQARMQKDKAARAARGGYRLS